jgi:hypothetical protein
MPMLPVNRYFLVNQRGITPDRKKEVKTEIKLGLTLCINFQDAKIQLLEKLQDMTELSTNYVTFTKFHR